MNKLRFEGHGRPHQAVFMVCKELANHPINIYESDNGTEAIYKDPQGVDEFMAKVHQDGRIECVGEVYRVLRKRWPHDFVDAEEPEPVQA